MSRRSGQNGSVRKHGNWYVVRYWIDVAGQEERQRGYAKICPVSGPGKLSASERERKAKEIIAASGADTVEHFNKVVRSIHGVTFRQQAKIWLNQVKTRKRKPVAPSTISTWECALENWIYPNIGDTPLDGVNNLAVKTLVEKMHASGKLGPSAIRAYVLIVKMVVGSAIDEHGEELYPRKWNHEFIDMPQVKAVKQPAFTGETVTKILEATAKGVTKQQRKDYPMLYALCAASGLRFGEALGIDIKHISPDCSTIKIVQKVWRGQIHGFLKTGNGRREVDLHSTIAAMLKDYIGDRTEGLLFQSRRGKPLSQSNILRRSLHTILANLKQPKCGAHAFRRFRNTYLRNRTNTPPGLRKFWMGWGGDPADQAADSGKKDMSDLYDKVRDELKFRKEIAEKAGLGFELPSKVVSIGPNGPKIESKPVLQLAVTA
jgi:integrase